MEREGTELFSSVKALLLLARAERMGAQRFLLDLAAEDLSERLSAITRSFPNALDLLTPGAAFAEALRGSGRVQRIAQFSGDWRAGFAPPESLDLVVCGMVMHRIDDVSGLLGSIRRALRPDGLLLAVFPGGDTLRELRAALLGAESAVRGAAALRVLPMIDPRAAGDLLRHAGFALPVADRERVHLSYPDLLALAQDLRAMGASAALLAARRPPLTRAILAEAGARYLQAFPAAPSRIRATIDLIWLSGWSPHASQQQPLKPGSAQVSLSQVLSRKG